MVFGFCCSVMAGVVTSNPRQIQSIYRQEKLCPLSPTVGFTKWQPNMK